MRKILRNIAFFCITISLGIAMYSCEKKELEPSTKGLPILSVQGNFLGAHYSWIIGDSTFKGTPSIQLGDTLMGDHFLFTDSDSVNILYPSITFDFVNYKMAITSINSDQDSTFTNGSKTYALFYNNPVNPLQLNTVSINLTVNNSIYTSKSLQGNTGNFNIDSTRVITWKDHKDYKLVYAHFSCNMVSFFNPQDSTMNLLSNGKAVLAFPRE